LGNGHGLRGTDGFRIYPEPGDGETRFAFHTAWGANGKLEVRGGAVVIWRKGDPWPEIDRWGYGRPTFPRCLGGPLEFVEILDEAEFPHMGYRRGGKEPLSIPDFLGKTRSGELVLYESKSKDHLDDAVQQLNAGLSEFNRLGLQINKLGIVLNVRESNEEWVVLKSGNLLGHRGLIPGTPIYLGGAHDKPIMVELRG
jgi:hypothetical protein